MSANFKLVQINLFNLFYRKIFLCLNYNFRLASYRKNVKVIILKFFRALFSFETCQNDIILRCCVFATDWRKRRSRAPDAEGWKINWKMFRLHLIGDPFLKNFAEKGSLYLIEDPFLDFIGRTCLYLRTSPHCSYSGNYAAFCA